jgi:Phosphotransferase enzyme family
MDKNIADKIKLFYGWRDCKMTAFGTGLINHTWKAGANNETFILQKINTAIFKNPEWIDDNISSLAKYFKEHHSGYLFVSPIEGLNKETLIKIEDDYYRCFPFVEKSHTIDVVQNTQQAYEAAKQFGKFTALLNEFDAKKLHITLNDFHHLGLRFNQFNEALQNGNLKRIEETKDDILFLQSKNEIVIKWENFILNKEAKQRVTHHDTKISNVLFNENDKGICVIDLDTIMPGYFISDVGDMMRTYVCPVSEEETNLDKIIIRKDYVQAIYDGYFSEMKKELSAFEQDHFYFSGEFMIYMQALRFLTDYLNNDVYYGRKYEKHNLVRARNQIMLLKQYQLSI